MDALLQRVRALVVSQREVSQPEVSQPGVSQPGVSQRVSYATSTPNNDLGAVVSGATCAPAAWTDWSSCTAVACGTAGTQYRVFGSDVLPNDPCFVYRTQSTPCMAAPCRLTPAPAPNQPSAPVPNTASCANVVANASNILRAKHGDCLIASTSDSYLQSTDGWFRLVLSRGDGTLSLTTGNHTWWNSTGSDIENTTRFRYPPFALTLRLGGTVQVTDAARRVSWARTYADAALMRINNDGSVFVYNKQLVPIGTVAGGTRAVNSTSYILPGTMVRSENSMYGIFFDGKVLRQATRVSGAVDIADWKNAPRVSFDNNIDAVSVVCDSAHVRLIVSLVDGTSTVIAAVPSPNAKDAALSLDNDGNLVLSARNNVVWNSKNGWSSCDVSHYAPWSECDCSSHQQFSYPILVPAAPAQSCSIPRRISQCIPQATNCIQFHSPQGAPWITYDGGWVGLGPTSAVPGSTDLYVNIQQSNAPLFTISAGDRFLVHDDDGYVLLAHTDSPPTWGAASDARRPGAVYIRSSRVPARLANQSRPSETLPYAGTYIAYNAVRNSLELRFWDDDSVTSWTVGPPTNTRTFPLSAPTVNFSDVPCEFSATPAAYSPCSGACTTGGVQSAKVYNITRPSRGAAPPCPKATRTRACIVDGCSGLGLAAPKNTQAPATPSQSDCQWHYAPASQCSVACGQGTRTRRVVITSPSASGEPCPKPWDYLTESCTGSNCSMDCVSHYKPITACSSACGPGTQQQQLVIDSTAAPGGAPCPLETVVTAPCNGTGCKRDCFITYGSWSGCSTKCDTVSFQTRAARIDPAQNGGLPCPPAVTVAACPANPACPVNCVTQPDGTVTNCVPFCGMGSKTYGQRVLQQAGSGGAPCPPAPTIPCNNPCVRIWNETVPGTQQSWKKSSKTFGAYNNFLRLFPSGGGEDLTLAVIPLRQQPYAIILDTTVSDANFHNNAISFDPLSKSLYAFPLPVMSISSTDTPESAYAAFISENWITRWAFVKDTASPDDFTYFLTPVPSTSVSQDIQAPYKDAWPSAGWFVGYDPANDMICLMLWTDPRLRAWKFSDSMSQYNGFTVVGARASTYGHMVYPPSATCQAPCGSGACMQTAVWNMNAPSVFGATPPPSSQRVIPNPFQTCTVPVTNGLVFHINADYFDSATNTWPDISPSRSNPTITGKPVVQRLLGKRVCVTGTPAETVRFPSFSFSNGQYTLLYVARYNGPNRNALLGQSAPTGNSFTGFMSGTSIQNWYSGFVAGMTGVALHYNYITSASALNTEGTAGWIVATDQNTLFRANSVDRTAMQSSLNYGCSFALGTTCNFNAFGINTIGDQKSDWAVACVLLYNRVLLQSEINTMEQFLYGNYGLFVNNGLVAYYDASDYVSSMPDTWIDSCGISAAATVTGNLAAATVSGITALTGGIGTVIKFPPGILGTSYTIFCVAKYNGPTRRRLLCSTSVFDWTCGFDKGVAGVASHNGVAVTRMTQSYNTLRDNSAWCLSTDQPNMYRYNCVNFTQYISYSDSPKLATPPANIGFNVDPTNASDFAVACLLVYNRALAAAEIASVEQFLQTKYRIKQYAPLPVSNVIAVYSADAYVASLPRYYFYKYMVSSTPAPFSPAAASQTFPRDWKNSTATGTDGTVYTASASTFQPARPPHNVFASTPSADSEWRGYGSYDTGTGTLLQTTTAVDDTTVYGEWLQVQSTPPIACTGVTIGNSDERTPFDFILAGSTDGSSFVSLLNVISASPDATRYTLTGNQYAYHRIIITRIYGGGTVAVMNAMSLDVIPPDTPVAALQWNESSRIYANIPAVANAIPNIVYVGNTGLYALAGSVNTRVTFGEMANLLVNRDVTMFHVSRYNGPSRQRIVCSDTFEWLSGHANGYAGVAKRGSVWITGQQNVYNATEWAIHTDQYAMYRYNGKTLSATSSASGKVVPGAGLGINVGWRNGEYSDWAVACLVVYDTLLDISSIAAVEAYLSNAYGIPLSN